MMGRSHLLAGPALVVITASCGHALVKSPNPLQNAFDVVLTTLGKVVPALGRAEGAHPTATAVGAISRWLAPHADHLAWVVLAAIVFLVGTIFSDADDPKSLAGRYLHLPLVHRGWTHTDWLLVALALMSLVDPTRLLAWFTLGVFTHDLLDELSDAGRCHWYPLTSHKVATTRRGTKVVVKPRWRGLYTVGTVSEYVLLGLLLLAAVAAWWYWLR